jgi:hypothetical protein
MLIGIPVLAQTAVPQATANEIVQPQFSGLPIGHDDADARAELQASIAAMGLSHWIGAQATGTITFVGAGTSVPMAYALLPGNKERLSFTGTRADELTVVNGSTGRVQSGKDLPYWMSSSTALAGVAPFALAEDFASPLQTYSIIDHGVTNLGGVSLHRVSIERTLPTESDDLLKRSSHSVLDCYFDTSTHVLVKTASMVTLPGLERQRVLRVITYSDYRPAGALTLPYAMSETIQGRSTWTLSISTFDTSNPPTIDQF